MTQRPPMISVLSNSHDCVGFLRSADARGFQAYGICPSWSAEKAEL